MRRIIFFSLFFLSVVLVKAQSEYSKLIEKGSESYSAGNYNNAAISFEKALSISEQNNNIDTALYYYVGLSHYLAKNYTPAINFFNKSILFNFEKEKALSFKADCFSNLNDIENQEQTLKIGFKLFPNSENILLGLINLYLSQSRYDDALKFLDIATSKSPNNAVLFFAKGAIFEKLNNRNLVYENYLKAITIDNTFFDAHYNIGVYYFNLGVETLTNANQISDIKKYDNQIEKAKLYFSKAVPFFENCYRIKSNDPQISESIEASLKSIYNRLKQDNKFEIRNNALLNGTLLNQIGLKIEIPGIENTKTVVYNAEDKEGPTITLLSPVNSRGFKEVVSENTVIVKGKISDKNSVLIATLNGAELSLGSDGSFEQKVMLTNGLNTINIQALDKFKNSSDYQFTVEQKKTNTIVSTGNNPQKQALVIGNGNYKNSPLKNASNDARIMAKTLKDLGFNVTLLVDATNVQIKSAVSKFGAELEKDKNSVGLFYYAGHGIQVNGKNFLVPIDAQIEREPDVPVYSFDLDGLLTNIEYSGNSMNIIILDACRNNPFARSFRSLNSNGLAQLNAPTGTIIAFATAPGSTASDGSGENGLYTQELVKAIQVPNIPIETAFKKVRTQVKNLSNGLQIPWENSSLEGDFYFKK